MVITVSQEMKEQIIQARKSALTDPFLGQNDTQAALGWSLPENTATGIRFLLRREME
jgi:hypothetical protein